MSLYSFSPSIIHCSAVSLYERVGHVPVQSSRDMYMSFSLFSGSSGYLSSWVSCSLIASKRFSTLLPVTGSFSTLTSSARLYVTLRTPLSAQQWALSPMYIT